MTETKKKPRGRPFKKGNQPVRKKPEREQDFGAFARSVLMDKRAQKALLKRAQRGDLPAHVIGMLVENASPQAQEEREPATAKELAAWMLESVPSFYRAALYDYWAGNRDANGVPTKNHDYQWRPVVARIVEPPRAPEEPELARVQPLGEARKRIEAAEKAAKASPVTQTDQEAEDAQRELEARETPRTRLPEDKPEHVDDNKHRSECRACRKRWMERENASVPLIRR